jgi:hypothetical protein
VNITMNNGSARVTGRRLRPFPARRLRASAAAVVPALAAVLAVAAAGPALAAVPGAAQTATAGTVTARAGTSARPGTGTPGGGTRFDALRLHPMPVGTVLLGRSHGRLIVHAAVYGLTPGSSHSVDLRVPGHGIVQFTRLTANSVGQARATLCSHYTGRLLPGSRLVIRMGTSGRGAAADPIAVTGTLGGPLHHLTAVEAGPASRGPLRGHATVSYNPSARTLTVIVSASGLSPGRHAAHIHVGSCMSQGPVKYMLGDLVAGPRGRIIHAVRTFRNVTAPIPTHGWYLNIHQGNTATIQTRNGQPTIFFRPLLCANIR